MNFYGFETKNWNTQFKDTKRSKKLYEKVFSERNAKMFEHKYNKLYDKEVKKKSRNAEIERYMRKKCINTEI